MSDGVGSGAHRLRIGCLSEWDKRRPVRRIPERRIVSASVLQRLLERECRCAVCLDTVSSTTAVCACLHRFCRPCIEGSIRMAKSVCPTCKASVASHRVLRDDARFQRIVDYLTKVANKTEDDESKNSDDKTPHPACFACSKEAAEALERQRKAAAAAEAESSQKKDD